MYNKDLAIEIARKIFEVGDDPRSKTYRIQFIGGSYDNEINQGGLAEYPLAMRILKTLNKQTTVNNMCAELFRVKQELVCLGFDVYNRDADEDRKRVLIICDKIEEIIKSQNLKG